MFVTKLALERSEQNFVSKFNHVTHLAWGLNYMSMPKGLPQAQFQGAAVGQSLQGSIQKNITMFVTKLAPESEQNFVTKLNHAPNLG